MAVQVQKLDAKNLLERSKMINNSKPARNLIKKEQCWTCSNSDPEN